MIFSKNSLSASSDTIAHTQQHGRYIGQVGPTNSAVITNLKKKKCLLKCSGRSSPWSGSPHLAERQHVSVSGSTPLGPCPQATVVPQWEEGPEDSPISTEGHWGILASTQVMHLLLLWVHFPLLPSEAQTLEVRKRRTLESPKVGFQ